VYDIRGDNKLIFMQWTGDEFDRPLFEEEDIIDRIGVFREQQFNKLE